MQGFCVLLFLINYPKLTDVKSTNNHNPCIQVYSILSNKNILQRKAMECNTVGYNDIKNVHVLYYVKIIRTNAQ